MTDLNTVLTVHNAQIRTAAVQINTLTIDGKQVTLAVFRQLPKDAWLNEEGTPRGPAWGTVNYCPDKSCRDYLQHLHLVWQDGVELRRDLFAVEREIAREFWHEDCDELVEAHWCLGGHVRYGSDWLRRYAHFRSSTEVIFTIAGMRCVANLRSGPSHECAFDSPDRRHRAMETLHQTVRRHRAMETLHQTVRREAARRQQVHEAYTLAKSLPQLFIAV